MISIRKAQMSRAANMMVGGEARLKQRVLTGWVQMHFGEKEAKMAKVF